MDFELQAFTLKIIEKMLINASGTRKHYFSDTQLYYLNIYGVDNKIKYVENFSTRF